MTRRPTALPRAPQSRGPATDYMNLTSDAITLLRYTRAALESASDQAPDVGTSHEIDKCLAKCRDAMTGVVRARQHVQGRYTPDGRPK